MKQSKEPLLLVNTVRCSFSENNCRHPFWPGFKVSTICTLCIDVPEMNRLFVELGHMLEYHLATAHWMASHPSVHSGPLHAYLDIFESATTPFRFKNFHVHTYPFSNRICPSTRIRILSSTQNSSGNIGNGACVVKTGKSRGSLAKNV